MSDVINLAERRAAKEPHRSGTARCLNCKHEWQAVAPIGAVTLECPECNGYQAVFKGIANTEFPQWQCACGEYMFFIDTHGAYCAHCGIRPQFN